MKKQKNRINIAVEIRLLPKSAAKRSWLHILEFLVSLISIALHGLVLWRG